MSTMYRTLIALTSAALGLTIVATGVSLLIYYRLVLIQPTTAAMDAADATRVQLSFGLLTVLAIAEALLIRFARKGKQVEATPGIVGIEIGKPRRESSERNIPSLQ